MYLIILQYFMTADYSQYQFLLRNMASVKQPPAPHLWQRS